MTDTPSRPPRLWRGLGLSAAALGLAAGPAVALTPAAPELSADQPRLWHVQAESGEAGESGEAAAETGEAGEQGEAETITESGEAGEAGEAGESGEATATATTEGGEAGEGGAAGTTAPEDPDTSFATRLLLLDAHLRSAVAAQQAQQPEEAHELVEEAEELFGELEEDLETRGVTGVNEAEIEAVEKALGTDGGAQPSFDTFSASLLEGLTGVPARARFDAVLAVTRAAADEHEEAAEDPVAGLEALAYLSTARAAAEHLARGDDAAVTEAGAAAVQALSEAERQLAEAPEDTTILPAAAARVELAALQVR